MATIKNLIIRIGAATKGIDDALDRSTRGMLKTAAAAKLMEKSANRSARALDGVGDQAVQLAGQLRLANAAMSNSFTRATGMVTKFGLALAGVSVAASGIGAGAAAGIAGVGAGFLGLGIALAATNAKVKKDWKKTFETIGADAKILAKPFVGPLREVSRIFLATWREIDGGLKLVFKTLAPVVVPIAKALASAFKDVFAAVGSIAVVAKPLLLDLATGIRQLGADIKDFLTPIVGALRTSAQGVFSSLLGGLGQILVALGPVVAQFIAFGTATIGPVLTALSQVLIELQPVIQALLAGLLPVVKEVVPAITLLANAFGAALAPILKTLGPIVAEVVGVLAGPLAKVIKIIGAGLLAVFQELAPHLPAMASAFGALLVAVAPLITPFTELVTPAANLATTLGGALVPIIRAVTSVAGPLVTAIGQVLAVIEPLLIPLGQLIASLIVGLLPVITALLPPLAQLFPVLLQIAQAVGAQLLAAIQQIIPHLPALVTSFVQLLAALVPLLPQILQLVFTLLPLIPVITDVIKLLTQLINAVMPILFIVFRAWIRYIQDAVAAIKWGFGIFYSVAKWTIEKVAGFFRWLYNLLIGHSIIPDLVNGMLAWFGRIPGGIMRALGNMRSLMVGAGRNIIGGLIDGIWSWASKLWSTMRRIVGGIRAFWPFSPAKVGPLSGSGAPNIAGANVVKMFAAGMLASRHIVAAASASLAAAASPMAGPVLATPQGAVTGGGSQVSLDAQTLRALADYVTAAMQRAGVGATYLDGEKISRNSSRREGLRTEQRRRTG